MKKTKFILIFLLISILFSTISLPASALDDPEVGAAAIVLVETNTGKVFFSRNADSRIYPASTTKIMTTLLALEAVEAGRCSLDDMVTASENMTYDLIPDGSSAGILVGETMSLHDLLYCAMISSANEACNVIGEYISGSVPSFVDLMNSRAAELGCTGTHFANAHGLPNEDHYSTAWDFYLIAEEAMSHPVFAEICNTAEYTVPATNLSAERTLSNTNGLINPNSYYTGYYYENAAGIKTGYTSAAGYCLISTASKGGLDLMAVVMGGIVTQREDGSNDYGSFSDSIALYEWAFENFSYRTILSSAETITSVPVTMGDSESVTLRPAESISALLPNDTDLSAFKREVVIYCQRDGEDLQAPVTAGETLGEVRITMDGVTYGTTKLVASGNVELSKMNYIKEQLSETLYSKTVKRIVRILIILFAVYLIIVIIYRIQRIRHLRSVRRAKRRRAAAKAEAAERARFEAEHAPREPEIEFFSPDSDAAQIPAAPDKKSAAPVSKPVPGSNANDRDYFEEFFRRQ